MLKDHGVWCPKFAKSDDCGAVTLVPELKLITGVVIPAYFSMAPETYDIEFTHCPFCGRNLHPDKGEV